MNEHQSAPPITSGHFNLGLITIAFLFLNAKTAKKRSKTGDFSKPVANTESYKLEEMEEVLETECFPLAVFLTGWFVASQSGGRCFLGSALFAAHCIKKNAVA